MIASVLLGWLPGPGGIPLFLAGLGLVSLNHEWAANLLKNFEKRREAITDKYLMSSPRTSHIIDFVSLVTMISGLYLAIAQSGLLYKGLGLALTSVSLIVLLSNQKRFERIAARFKKHNK